MKLAGEPATDTLPQAAAAQCRERPASRPACARRTAASGRAYCWRECSGPRARFRAGAGGARVQARRQAVGARRQPPPPLLGAARGAGAGRHVRAALPGLDRQRACYVLAHAEVSVVVAEDQEQVDKVLSMRGELPNLRLVVYEDPRGMSAYDDDHAQVVRGRSRQPGAPSAKEHPDYFERELDQGRADDVALIAYTSGTTGRSEGRAAEPRQHDRHVARASPASSRCSAATTGCAICRWAGSATRCFSLGTSLVVGATCNCPESPETVQRDLRELGPSALLAPPRIWESMLTGPAGQGGRRVAGSSGACTSISARLAERRELLKGDGKPIPSGTRLALPARRGAWSTARCATSWACAMRAGA